MPILNKSLIQRRTNRIETLSDGLASLIKRKQDDLANKFLAGFINQLETDKYGNILNSAFNKQLANGIDAIYDKFLGKFRPDVIQEVVTGVDDMLVLNKQYFNGYATKGSLNKMNKAITAEINELLGVTESGDVILDGYLNTVLSDRSVKAKIQNHARRAILSKRSQSKYRAQAQKLIAGDDKQSGILQGFYRDNLMDVVAQSDRAISTNYADSLGLVFAIYEGNVIKTTRDFCRARAGKVFHISEIKAFDPSTAKPPTYNPLLDLGGYNCRHHLNWITIEMALRLRKDAKQFLKTA